MADIRPAASLTSSLLARRGDARPAMRRQPIGNLNMPLSSHDDLGWNDIGDDPEHSEHSPPQTSLAAMTPRSPAPAQEISAPVEPQSRPEPEPEAEPHPHAPAPISPLTHHLEAISQRLNHAPRDTGFKPMIEREKPAKRLPKAALAASRKAAFTLRIDSERHLRLRLLSALVNRSSQQLLIEALDALLASHDRVEDLAGQVENKVGGQDEAGF